MKFSEELGFALGEIADLPAEDRHRLVALAAELDGLLAREMLGDNGARAELSHVRASIVSIAARHASEVQDAINERIDMYFKRLVALLLL